MLTDFCPAGEHRPNPRASVGVLAAKSCLPHCVVTPFSVRIDVGKQFTGSGTLTTWKWMTVRLMCWRCAPKKGIDGLRATKALLKFALRKFGLRVVAIREGQPGDIAA